MSPTEARKLVRLGSETPLIWHRLLLPDFGAMDLERLGVPALWLQTVGTSLLCTIPWPHETSRLVI